MLQHFHAIYVSTLKIKDQNTGNRNVIQKLKKKPLKLFENLKEAIVNIIKEKFSDESWFWMEKV